MMTASDIREWVREDGKVPEWVAEQPADTQEHLHGYWRTSIVDGQKDTVKNRATAVRQFAEWFGADITVATTSDVDEWKEQLVLEGYGYRSVRQKIYALSTYYNWLQDREGFEGNPVDGVDVEKYEKTKQDEHLDRQYVTKEEFEQMMEACETTRESLICRLFWDCGVRVGEAVEIRLNDIDRSDKSIVIESGKTKKMEIDEKRTVYYSQSLESIITEWLDNGARDSYFGSSGDYLIVSKEAEQMVPGSVSDIVRRVADRADILKEVYEDQSGRTRYFPHPHALRKSYGVYRTERGMPIAYLSKLMGHADIETTRDKYLKFREEDIREADRRYRPTV
jgi:integrase/recombinase XerD